MNHFLALPLPPPVRDAVAVMVVDWRRALPPTLQARWYAPEDYHITLKFLGDITPEAAHGLVPVMQRIADRTGPIMVRLAPLGGFPDLHEPFVLWAGVKTDETLFLLASALDGAAASHGFAGDKRAYRPHVTLAHCRVARDGPAMQEPVWDERAFPAWLADGFVLMETTPPERRRNDSKTRYNIVHLFPFGTTPSSAE